MFMKIQLAQNELLLTDNKDYLTHSAAKLLEEQVQLCLCKKQAKFFSTQNKYWNNQITS